MNAKLFASFLLFFVDFAVPASAQDTNATDATRFYRVQQ